MRTRLMGSCLIVILTAVASQAETPLGTSFTYQGQLKNSGSPASGSFNMVFQLFDALSLGNQVGPTLTFDGAGGNPPPVSVTNGLFTVPIDFGTAAFSGNKRWLSITVGGTTLAPRQELTPAPNALNADKLDGLNSTAFLQSIPMPLTLSGTSNTHIIRAENTSTGFLPMAIYGYCPGASGGTTGVRGESASTNGRGVIGFATAASGTTYGGQFESTSPNGTGVWGKASATSGSAYGVEGESASVSGRGVYGVSTAATGVNYGVYGQTTSAQGFGVYGRAIVNGGYGVFGSNASTTGSAVGVRGETASTSGRAIWGVANAATGTAYGVEGETFADNGFGVAGYAHNSDGGTGVFGRAASSIFGYGVRGQNTGATGTGVLGEGGFFGVQGYATATGGLSEGVRGQCESPTGKGVAGYAPSGTGTSYGVLGDSGSSTDYGVYSAGDMHVTGDLSATGSKGGYVTDLVLNAGDEPLDCGDLVEIVGHDVPIQGDIPVIRVRKSRLPNSRAVLGPVDCAVTLNAKEPEATRQGAVPRQPYAAPQYHVHRTDGAIASGAHGRVVTLGAFKLIRVDASFGAVSPGDLLVTSPNPGHAMRAADPKVGTVVGKALGRMEHGTGTVPILVQSG